MRSRNLLIWIALVLLTALVISYLGKGLYHLIFDPSADTPVDLNIRRNETLKFQRGESPYPSPDPPWAYVGGTVLFGLPWPLVRSTFAAINLIALAWCIDWFIRRIDTSDRAWKYFIALSIAGTAAVCTTLGNGQYGILIMAFILAAVSCDRSSQPAVRLLGGCFLALSLNKYSISGTFLLVFLIRGRWLLLAAAAVTLCLETFIFYLITHVTPLEALQGMQQGSLQNLNNGYSLLRFANLIYPNPKLLVPLVSAISVVVLLFLMKKRRGRQPLDLVDLAIAGVVGRIGTYHAHYDNMMIWPLMIGLLELARRNGNRSHYLAASLVTITLLMPARAVDYSAVQVGHLIVWFVGLIFLVRGSSSRVEMTQPSTGTA